MFLHKNYILANELVQKMDIHIANISMLHKILEDTGNDSEIIKINNCTFINSDSIYLPQNIKKGILGNKFTNMSNKLPCTFIKTEFNISEKELLKSGIVNGKVTVAGKQFYEFKDSFIQTIKGKVLYVLDKQDTMDCLKNDEIDGYIEMSKNKFLTWY